ncbi:MAG: hypothetical protein ABF743_10900 [Schleiferilactobacillus perolens]|uniref:hypothetical protein n=1 Tax=Schleiferilactobacillus perolens TaxID=100468 RepID=UPI0039E9BE1D
MANNTKTFNLNNVGAKTFIFNINRTPFELHYTDDSLQDLVMLSNQVKDVTKKYADLEKKVNNDSVQVDRAEVASLFQTMKSALMDFYDKAFGAGQGQKLYDTVGGVVMGGLTTVFDLVAGAINDEAAGSAPASVKGVKPNAKPYRNR